MWVAYSKNKKKHKKKRKGNNTYIRMLNQNVLVAIPDHW